MEETAVHLVKTEVLKRKPFLQLDQVRSGAVAGIEELLFGSLCVRNLWASVSDPGVWYLSRRVSFLIRRFLLQLLAELVASAFDATLEQRLVLVHDLTDRLPSKLAWATGRRATQSLLSLSMQYIGEMPDLLQAMRSVTSVVSRECADLVENSIDAVLYSSSSDMLMHATSLRPVHPARGDARDVRQSDVGNGSAGVDLPYLALPNAVLVDNRVASVRSADRRSLMLAYPGAPPSQHAVLRGHTASITVMLPLQAGRFIVTGSQDATLRVWNCITERCLAILSGHHDIIQEACVIDQDHLLSVSSDGSACVWDLASILHPNCADVLFGQALRVSEPQLRLVTPSRDPIWCCTCIGSTVALGYHSGTVRFWETSDCNAAGLAAGSMTRVLRISCDQVAPVYRMMLAGCSLLVLTGDDLAIVDLSQSGNDEVITIDSRPWNNVGAFVPLPQGMIGLPDAISWRVIDPGARRLLTATTSIGCYLSRLC